MGILSKVIKAITVKEWVSYCGWITQEWAASYSMSGWVTTGVGELPQELVSYLRSGWVTAEVGELPQESVSYRRSGWVMHDWVT